MRALVTGGSGLRRLLARQGLARGGRGGDLARPRGRLTQRSRAAGDRGRGERRRRRPARLRVGARSAARADRIDSVFHLAAQPIVGDANASPIPTFETNIEGTWVLLEACREAGCRAASSSLPRTRPTAPTTSSPTPRTSALQPIFPYDVSKAATDLIARSYWHTYGLPVAVTRFANLYGGGERNFSRLIPETVTAVLEGRRPVIRSDGSPERDFLYVEDAARRLSGDRRRRSRTATESPARRSTPAGAGRIRSARWSS